MMHTPKNFQQSDVTQLKALICHYPFANVITYSDSKIETNHLPLILAKANNKEVLQGHIAKVNPLWRSTAKSMDALVVFNGPNCYVSPNYYPTKKEHGKAVPTWNYMTVHVRGSMRFIHDDDWNLIMLNQLTLKEEKQQKTPWSIADAPKNYITKMLNAIVGIEIEITSMTGQWKLSQNQAEINKKGVVAGLQEYGDDKTDAQKIAELVGIQLINNN